MLHGPSGKLFPSIEYEACRNDVIDGLNDNSIPFRGETRRDKHRDRDFMLHTWSMLDALSLSILLQAGIWSITATAFGLSISIST